MTADTELMWEYLCIRTKNFVSIIKHDIDHMEHAPNADVYLGVEGRKALNSTVKVSLYGPPTLRLYKRDQAVRLLRRCNYYPGTINNDWDQCVPQLLDEDRNYGIREIRDALKLLDQVFPGNGSRTDVHSEIYNRRRLIELESARAEVKELIETDYGTGFFISEHFVLTSKHVIDTQTTNDSPNPIYISNDVTGERIQCEVIHVDPGSDLALLHCQHAVNGVYCLQLCDNAQSTLTGMQIGCFGFPNGHSGGTALFIPGSVSGMSPRYGREPLMVLCCPLSHGTSGAPVISLPVKGHAKAVGVVLQKQILMDILTQEEKLIIAKVQESFNTSSICDLEDDEISNAGTVQPDPCQEQLNLLLLKLYNCLETHCQSGLSKAVPATKVQEFIKDAVTNYSGDHCEELARLNND